MPAMRRKPDTQHEMMAPYEVAQVFKVDPKTVGRWAKRGRIRSLRTPGGHRRYFRAEIEALVAEGLLPAKAESP